MSQRLQLSAEHERIVRDILGAHLPVGTHVRAFGSRVWGNPRRYSDLDLAIMGRERKSLASLADLADAFLESDLPFEVDLSDWRELSPALQEAVSRDGVELTTTHAA